MMCLVNGCGAAAVAWGAGEALVMEEVQVSPPQTMEIWIKVVCTSLCRSDLAACLGISCKCYTHSPCFCNFLGPNFFLLTAKCLIHVWNVAVL